MFLSGDPTKEVAQRWLEGYNENNTEGVCRLVNFVLKCTGCDLQVEDHDIDDPDNAPNKLTDLQEEYQSQSITDYPLIQRIKGNQFSRSELESFFHDLIDTIHRSGTLYEDQPLYPNIETWVVPMTSSPIRPFRHTATVIALALTSAFCEVMKDLDLTLALTTRQKQQEEKSKKKAKDKIASYDAKIAELETRKQDVDRWIRELFDSVFIHRYRDVDPKIRSDCIVALGSWVETCPDIFFEGTFLRYLGWLMSDQNHTVRHQVLAQFQRLYNKDTPDVGRLRAFTQRFRDRMVEIATRDSEISIRAMAVDLLDSIRHMGLLETDHIETVGQLIFDADPKVRKAVAPFFASNVKDAYHNITEALGGEEGLEDVLGQEVENDYESPSAIWLKYKSIAQLLDEYDGEDDVVEEVKNLDALASWSMVPSRYMTAAEVVYEGIEDVSEKWPMLAGYLLYDVTAKQTTKKRKSQDPLELFKQRCNLTDKQEKLLLEVLVVAAKHSQAEGIENQGSKRSKRHKARTAEEVAKAEQSTRNVVTLLPRLLRKFGANPPHAAIVLRMAQNVSFSELSEDSVEYESLLDDVGKQYLYHADRSVLDEATSALLHASKHHDLEDATATKINELWGKVSANLRQNVRAKSVRLDTIASNVFKVLKLAEISDPRNAFILVPSQMKTKDGSNSLLELLIGLIETYTMTEDADAEAIVIRSAVAITKFYMWTITTIQTMSSTSVTLPLVQVPYRGRFTTGLISFIRERHKTDASRIAAINTLLDAHTVFTTLRQVQIEDAEASTAAVSLIQEISKDGEDLICSSFVKLEKQFAKKTGKSLKVGSDDGVEDAPESDDEDDDAEDLDEEEQTQKDQQRQQERLLLERSLCELAGKLVLAILARVIDASGPDRGNIRKTLLRNKNKLGPNFKEVVSYLDGPKSKKSAKSKHNPSTGSRAALPDINHKDLVEEEEDEIEDVEEGDEEDLRRRELLPDEVEDEIEDEDGNEEASNDDVEDDITGD